MSKQDPDDPAFSTAPGALPAASRTRFWLPSLLLFALGTSYCLYYGRIGYMPLDSPIVFDGGWRVLSGQVPFRDFTTPTGIVPIIIQAAFFKVLGVTWFAYCLHAALFNGAFCVLVLRLLRLYGGSERLSFFYALLSGVVYYPPMGIPFADQHAFFFTLLLVYLSCYSSRSGRPGTQRAIWMSLPFVAILGYLSKPVPTVFGFVLAILILASAKRVMLPALVRSLLTGALAALTSLGALAATIRVDPGLVDVYFFKLPAETGRLRFAGLLTGWNLLFVLVLLALFFATRWFLPIRSGATDDPSDRPSIGQAIAANLAPLAVGLAVLYICSLFVNITKNQKENGFPLGFASIGLIHIFLQGIWRGGAKDLLPATFVARRLLPLAVGSVLCVGALRVAWVFHRHVNVRRLALDIGHAVKTSRGAREHLPEALSFLVWHTPRVCHTSADDLVRVVDFFRANPGSFFLIGDSSILYALTSRPSVSPALWFHPGMTMPPIRSALFKRPPSTESPFFRAFEDSLLANMAKYKVRYIVVEAVKTYKGVDCTWQRVTLTSFPELQKRVNASGRVRASFGSFRIYELGDTPS